MQECKLPTITKEELLKINICVAHPQNKNRKATTYAYKLSRVLKVNNLTSMNTQTIHPRSTSIPGTEITTPPETLKCKLTPSMRNDIGVLNISHKAVTKNT